MALLDPPENIFGSRLPILVDIAFLFPTKVEIHFASVWPKLDELLAEN